MERDFRKRLTNVYVTVNPRDFEPFGDPDSASVEEANILLVKEISVWARNHLGLRGDAAVHFIPDPTIEPGSCKVSLDPPSKANVAN